jgi:regulator of protease activity HflC (stomatin/prohibitin superfamily)
MITVQNQTKRYSSLEAYSRDQQPADLTVSVTYVVADPSAVYSQYGDLEGAVMRLIDPRLTAGVKTIFGQYDACARSKNARH